MSRLDFHLKHQRRYFSESSEPIHVLLKLNSELRDPADLGFRMTSRAGDIVAGILPANKLDDLAADPSVDLVECHRPLKDELDESVVAINLEDEKHVRQIPGLGAGALIGVIDSGFELTHPAFQRVDPKSPQLNPLWPTRILAAWDQSNNGSDNGPADFRYGVEYSRDDIDTKIQAKEQLVIAKPTHGTPVTAIAAGSGLPEGIFKGVAPEADLILVAYKNEVEVGASAFVLDAIQYILGYARRVCKPVVINFSQGDNLGAHDGSSLLEQAIDRLSESDKVLLVNSAGNSRGVRQHAEGKVSQGETYELRFSIKPIPANVKPPAEDVIDLWYSRGDEFAVALKDPDGLTSLFVRANTDDVVRLSSGVSAHVYSELHYPINHDNRITIVRGEDVAWKSGVWSLLIRGDVVRDGNFHVWADRHLDATAVTFVEPSSACTVTLPGTAKNIITVGGFVSRPSGLAGNWIKGALSDGSSAGPTRKGALKPNLAAPGGPVMTAIPTTFSVAVPPPAGSAVEHNPNVKQNTFYVPKLGTSMAAPHVAGVIALLWSLKPELTPCEIREALFYTAMKDRFTGEKDNFNFGHGKLNAKALYQALFQLPKGEPPMPQTFNFDLNLLNGAGEGTPVSIQIAVDDNGDAQVTGTSPAGNVTTVLHISISKITTGGDECWDCSGKTCVQVPC